MSTQTPKVFYIESNAFLRSYFEKALKSVEKAPYVHDGTENPDYLIKDLSPELIICDAKIWHHVKKEWAEELFLDSEIPVAFAGFKDELEHEDFKDHAKLEKPFNNETLLSDLANLLNQSLKRKN